MTTWFVRPDTSHNVTRDGTSYSTAWGGWASVVWGVSGVSLGDTLKVCGTFSSTTALSLGAHLATSEATRVTIRGDAVEESGAFIFTGTGYLNSTRIYTSFVGLTITGTAGFNCILNAATSGVVIEDCELIGGTNGVSLNNSTVFTSVLIRNNYIHDQLVYGINHTVGTASIAPGGVVITGNRIVNSGHGVHAEMNSTNDAWTTSRFAGYKISGNTISDCVGSPIYIRSCNNDQVTDAAIYSTEVEISGNTIVRCGTPPSASSTHGGILVMGCASAFIFGNAVRDCYVTGAGIQTAKNQAPIIYSNTISGIRAGTPTGSFKNGFAIDGNGIFFDIFTRGGLAFGNHISDLISTGNVASGVGLSFWNAASARFIGNVVENCACGASYGNALETGNIVYHNTFINCTEGVYKVGADALAGNLTAKNNILKNCATGFLIGANPSITADYNCVHGSTTPYSGIAAGSNDSAVDPQLDTAYRPATATAGTYLGGIDYNGKEFGPSPSMGAVGVTIPRTTTTRQATRRGA